MLYLANQLRSYNLLHDLMSVLGSVLFLGGSFLFVKGRLLVYWFIWVRGTLPRVRYDQLMELL